MKKVIAVILCVLVLVSLTACGGSKISGTWTYSGGGYSSIVKFRGSNKVIWTMKAPTGEESLEGTYYFDEEREEVTVTMPGFGTKTYDVSLGSTPQIDFYNLPHRR